MGAGHIDSQKRIIGEEGMNPRAALREVLLERGGDASFLEDSQPSTPPASSTPVQKATCDVCSAPTNFQEGTRFSAVDFRKTVERGFEPLDRVLSSLAQKSGQSKEAALESWKTGLVATLDTDWLLCPDCNVSALPYSPWKMEENAVLVGCLIIVLVGGYFLFGKAYSE